MDAGLVLRLETLAPATIHWSVDGWVTSCDTEMSTTGLDTYVADLSTTDLAPDATVIFTFYWHATQRWEGSDFMVQVVAVAPAS